MGKQLTRFLLFGFFCVRIYLISLTSVLNKNVVSFENISEAYLSFGAQNLYILSKNPDGSNGQLNQYSISNGDLVYQRSLPTQSDFSIYWQIYDFQTELVSFPIDINQPINIYNRITKNATNIAHKHIFFRGIWSRIYQIAFFSTAGGEIGYGTLEDVRNGGLTLMEHPLHIGKTFLSLSPNQRYLCSTDMITGLVSIWDTINKVIFQEIRLNQNGIISHCWTSNSHFLYVFAPNSGNIYQFNSKKKFETVAIMSTQIPYIFSTFYSNQSGQIIAIAANKSSLFMIDLNRMNVSQTVLDFTPTKMNMDISKRYLTLMSNNNLSIFKIEPFCNQSQYYNLSARTCMSCKTGCATCDGFNCISCLTHFQFNKQRDSCIGVTPTALKTPVSQLTQSIAKGTFSAINQTINVPGHRQFLKIFFQLFSNFEHFLLYIYHNRTFGTNMQNILQQIHDTVDLRFHIINQDFLKKHLRLNFTYMQESIDYKFDYSLEKYIELQQCGQGFFESNIHYLFLNIPLIVLTLVFYRIIYKMLSHFKLSILLKRFTYSGLIILLLLQGNTQFFYFSFVGDFLTLFSKHSQHKWLNVTTIAAAFIFLLLSTFGIVYLYLIYRKRASYFYENCKIGSLTTAFYFVFVFGIFNILRGIIHRTAIAVPGTQAFLLFLLQLSEVSLMLVYWKRLKLFQSTLLTVLILTGSVSRSLFNLSLLMSSLISLALLDDIHVLLFLVNVLTFFISIVQNIYELIITFKRLLSNKITNHQHHLTIIGKPTLLIKDSVQKSGIGSKESSETASEVLVKYSFKSKASITNNAITFRFCKKNVKNILTIKERTNKLFKNVFPRSQLQSINLQ